MKRISGLIVLAVAAGAGCRASEYTGRRQLLLVDERTEAQLGQQAYQQALAEQGASTNVALVEPVRRVGRRLADVARKPDYAWEFNVIESDTVNAWCLPGGKIAFYTGIFPVLQDEAGMAFVMGHEIAHALLRHGAERMSQNLAAQLGGTLLGTFVGIKYPEQQKLVMAAYGMGVGVGVLLPYSRKHESEADAVGLELMAKAGYDPRSSVEVWKRMAQVNPRQPPEFLSTHPSHETRIRDLEERLPQALALYEAAPRAAVARLPAAGPEALARGPGRKAPGPAAVDVVACGARAGKDPQGRSALLFEFAFEEDVFLDRIEVQGPGGRVGRVEAGVGIPARARRQFAISGAEGRPPPFGRYTVSFHGRSSGRPFTARCGYDPL
jgi:Zn-dependent protease with chaperone function